MCDQVFANEPVGSACSDDVFCNGTDTCDEGGACTNHSGDPCDGPDGDADCSETCDENSNSCSGNDPAASACEGNGVNECSAADTCDGSGVCEDNDAAVGTECGDTIRGDCRSAACDGSGLCDQGFTNDPNGTPCDDDLFCNGVDTCEFGTCVSSGEPCAGPDGDGDCAESCDEDANDCFLPDVDGSVCDDGDPETNSDRCNIGICVGSTDVDSDGVNDEDEDGAPNGGDANGDGVPDAEQSHVASLLSGTGSGYVTVVVDPNCPLSEVSTSTEQQQPEISPEFAFPAGLVAFIAECEATLVEVIFHELSPDVSVTAYAKYGPLPPGSTDAQYYVLDNVSFTAKVVGNADPVISATFPLADNERGDDTGDDGRIVDAGGVAIVLGAQPAPVLGRVGLAVLATILMLVGVARSRSVDLRRASTAQLR